MVMKLYNSRLFKSRSAQDAKSGDVYSQEAQRLYELDNEYEKQEARLARLVRYQKRQAGNV